MISMNGIDEYISKVAFADKIQRIHLRHKLTNGEEMVFTETDILSLLMCSPAADVAPVVRCESCEFYGKGFGKVENCLLFPGLVGPGPEDYCSYGRQKEVVADEKS